MKSIKKISAVLIIIVGVLLTASVDAQTVYITKSGTKYHTGTCRYVQSSKMSISLSDAKAKGYTACSVCKPPSTITSTPTEKKDTTTINATPKATQTTKPATSTTSSKQCSAITQAGTRCKRTTKSPNGKCWQHGGN